MNKWRVGKYECTIYENMYNPHLKLQKKMEWEEYLVNNPTQPHPHIVAKYYGNVEYNGKPMPLGHGVRTKKYICKGTLQICYHGVSYKKKVEAGIQIPYLHISINIFGGS